MVYEKQQEVKKALRENFPLKTPQEIEKMFSLLMLWQDDIVDVYIKKVDGQVWRVGVTCSIPSGNFPVFFRTEHEPRPQYD